MVAKYTVASMFAGVGGICLGFKNQGAKIIWANEIDKYACITYIENFGDDYLVEGDIKDVHPKDIPSFDILTSGFPCQAFSIAGYRKGFEDERGNLFFETLNIIKEKKPRVFLIENVKNLLSHDKGKTFKIISIALESEGYHIKYQILNSMMYGNVPQNRERIYIVGFKNINEYNKFSFPTPIDLDKSIHNIIDINIKQDSIYYYTEKSPYYNMLRDAIINEDTVYQLRRIYVRENKSNVCPTLTANMGTGGHNVPLIKDKFGMRKLTPKECFAFQGFPENFRIPTLSNCHLYKQAGNSVTVTVVSRIAKNIISVLTECDKEYTHPMENLYIMSNKKYYDHLIESRKQIERGAIVIKSTEELEEMANE